jgi:hypothetical protein
VPRAKAGHSCPLAGCGRLSWEEERKGKTKSQKDEKKERGGAYCSLQLGERGRVLLRGRVLRVGAVRDNSRRFLLPAG